MMKKKGLMSGVKGTNQMGMRAPVNRAQDMGVQPVVADPGAIDPGTTSILGRASQTFGDVLDQRVDARRDRHRTSGKNLTIIALGAIVGIFILSRFRQ